MRHHRKRESVDYVHSAECMHTSPSIVEPPNAFILRPALAPFGIGSRVCPIPNLRAYGVQVAYVQGTQRFIQGAPSVHVGFTFHYNFVTGAVTERQTSNVADAYDQSILRVRCNTFATFTKVACAAVARTAAVCDRATHFVHLILVLFKVQDLIH